MTAWDLLSQWSINVDCVTICVAVVRQLHGLLTAGRLYSTYPILLVHPYPWPMRTVAEIGLTQTALAAACRRSLCL